MDQGPRIKGLPLTAVVVLYCMALDARDTASSREPAAHYFRGWPHLVAVLGYEPGTRAGEEAVRKAIAELRTRGLVEPVARRGKRGNRVYRLHLLIPS
jgi:hypothetical protein